MKHKLQKSRQTCTVLSKHPRAMAGWQIPLHFMLVLCLTGSHAYSEAGKYFVTAPSSTLPGSSYTLTVQVIDVQSPVNFFAYLDGYGGYNYTSHQTIYREVTPIVNRSVSPGAVETLTLQIPPNIHNITSQKGQYRLHVRGTGALQIEETKSVTIGTQVATIFIQTDKSTYEPGDRVTFKTFGFYKDNLTPYTGVYSIALTAGRVVLNEWQSIDGAQVNTFHYDLDNHTVLGTWTISVNSVLTGSSSRSFTVGHRLPALTVTPTAGGSGVYADAVTIENSAIDVKVNLPKTQNSSTDLTGSFEATYPLGVGVKGRADIKLTSGAMVTRKSLLFQGNGTFTFPYNYLKSPNTQVVVSVTEEETGITGTGQASVNVYTRDVKIEFTEQTPAVFKPRLPFTAYIKITNHADEPLHIPADSVYSTVYVHGVGHYNRVNPNYNHDGVLAFKGTYPFLARKLTLPDSGFLSLDLDIPDDVDSIDLMVTFQGVQKKLALRQAQNSPGDSYLQIYLVDRVPAVSRTQTGDVRFRAVSSKSIKELTVEMVSRGKIVSAVKPALTNIGTSGDSFSVDFSLTLTWEMTPMTEVIAYHIVESDHSIQEVISDSMVLNVQSLVDNTITVTSEQQEVSPGQDVVLNVQTGTPATVGILVEEDNGASGLVITPQSVSSKLNRIGLLVPMKEAAATTQQFTSSSFRAADIMFMDGRRNFVASITSPIRQTPFTGNVQTHDIANTVFMGTNTTGPDGSTKFTVTLPDTVTTWSVTGFAFDDSGHVAVVNQPLLIKAVHEVYGELLGPDHVVSGEQLVLTGYVHNARDVESQVTVTLSAKENVEILNIIQGGSSYASVLEYQQTVMVPAKNSKQVFFAVSSPVDGISYTTTAHLELTIQSGVSKQTLPYIYTVTPPGVEKTFTHSALTMVNGHVTQNLTVSHPYPKEALPGTVTTRVILAEEFSDLVLPLVLAEDNVLEEGTGEAALLHFALPVMVAQHRPNMTAQLTLAIRRSYQRLMTFLHGYSFRNHPRYSSSRDWVDVMAMRMIAEAKQYVYISEDLVTNTLFKYNSYYHQADAVHANTVLDMSVTDTRPLGNREALSAFYAIAIKDVHNYVDVYHNLYNGQEKYTLIMNRVHRFLQQNFTGESDPLTLSYLALGCAQYGYSTQAQQLLSLLLALRNTDNHNTDEIYWSSDGPDHFNYYGDWMPGYPVASSRDVVIAANALQALVLGEQMTESEKVARWLMRQRHGNGAFKTAWDTLAATEALLAYSSKYRDQGTSLNLHTDLTREQSSQWLSQGQLQNFTATGQGEVFSQVEVKYHVSQNVGDSPFKIVPVVLDESLHHFKLMICSRWLLTGMSSGEVVQEVTIPSGFVTDPAQVDGQSGVVQFIQRSNTAITIYFRQVGSESTCYTLPVDRVEPVAHTAPSYIFTRSLEQPEFQDIVTYQTHQLTESTVCSLCPTCCP